MATRDGETPDEQPDTGLYAEDTKDHYPGDDASDGGPPEVVRAKLRLLINQKQHQEERETRA